MKNKIIICVIFPVLLTIAFGCGASENLEKTISGNSATNVNGAANKSLSDRAIETAVGDEKIGVAECDRLLENLAAVSHSEDDSYVTKAARQFAINKIRENIKKSIEENKNDKAQLAKDCREFHAQLDKYKTEEAANKQ